MPKIRYFSCINFLVTSPRVSLNRTDWIYADKIWAKRACCIGLHYSKWCFPSLGSNHSASRTCCLQQFRGARSLNQHTWLVYGYGSLLPHLLNNTSHLMWPHVLVSLFLVSISFWFLFMFFFMSTSYSATLFPIIVPIFCPPFSSFANCQ